MLAVTARLLAAALAALLLASPAAAQPSSRDLATARTLFRDGVAASEAGDWTRALDLFERAHALSQRADVLLNVAAAQIELGRLIDAGETYRRFLVDADAPMLERHQADVSTALEDLDARTPRIRITVIGRQPGDVVVLDDEPLDDAAIGVAVPVDPGAHGLALRRAGTTVAEERFTLTERARQDVTLQAETAAAADGPVLVPTPVDEGERTAEALPSSTTPQDGGGSDATPFIVLGVVGGVLVVGAAITVGVVLGTQSEPPIYQGSVFPYSIDVE